MPKVELEIGDNGEIGTLPEPLQKFFDSKFGEAFWKGKAKAAEEARGQLAHDPVERERLKALELENSRLKEAEALAQKNYAEAEKIRNERHAKEVAERDEAIAKAQAEIDRRTTRVRELVSSQIREIAVRQGARDASLDELALLLGQQVGLDDALQPIVTDRAGKALLDKDGKPVSIEGFVSSYLADHPHHRAAPAGRGGGAPGGRSLAGPPPTGVAADKADAFAAVEQAPTVHNIARAFALVGKG